MGEKKVGILTFHRARNIGTCLQAYALQKYLEDQKKTVEFIDYRPQYIEDSFGIFIKELYRQAKGNAKKIVLFWIKTILRLPFSSIRERKFGAFRKEHLKISQKTFYKREEMKNIDEEYSHIFFGSDQVWNPQLTEGIDTVFFGDFGADKVIKASYAASLGANVLTVVEQEKLRRSVEYLDYVGVREESAKAILEELNVKNVIVNIDPTLLVDKSVWDSISKPSTQKEKYILVYTLEINEELIKIVREISEKKNMKVVCLDMKNRYGKHGSSKYTTDPTEFIGLVEEAEYVITNSFHGTVFSIIYEKKFLSIPHMTRSTRVKDLLSKLGIEERMVFTKKECIDIDADIDYISVKKKLDLVKKESQEYIKMVLN